jgi:hypothetical protein
VDVSRSSAVVGGRRRIAAITGVKTVAKVGIWSGGLWAWKQHRPGVNKQRTCALEINKATIRICLAELLFKLIISLIKEAIRNNYGYLRIGQECYHYE